MMKQIICFKNLFIFLLPIALLGQDQKNNFQNFSYEKLTDLYFENENSKSKQLIYAKAYLSKAKNEDISIKVAKGYYLLSLLTDNEKAISFLDSVIKYSKEANDKNFPASAYSEKAYKLKKLFKFNEAIDSFILAEKYAKINNIDYYYYVRFSIAVLKSEELGEVEDALELYTECLNYYKRKDIKNINYSQIYQNVIFGLADVYKSLKQTDSTTYYNIVGYNESIATKNEEFKYLFVLNEGANLILKKKYKSALDSINKALPKIIEYDDKSNILASYYYLAKAFIGLNKKKEAVKNFIKVDSIYNITKEMSFEFSDGYTFLISHYKDKGDKKNQLKYLTTYMIIDSTLQKNYKDLSKKLKKEYDNPHLFSKKDTLISSLQTDKFQYSWIIGILIMFSLGIIIFALHQKRLNKIYKIRFKQIVTNSNQISNFKKEIIIQETFTNEMSEVIIQDLLKKLRNFEDKKQFLQPNLKIENLSKEFISNSKYLSIIVNKYKQKTFVQYINDLRIDYAVANLQNNNKLRKYTIQALSTEFGFNNAESFSAAFYKKTGIKPTFFIKEFERI